MATRRRAHGIDYYSYTLHDLRRLRSLHDIPRDHWPILKRTGNYEPRNRLDHRDGAWPQLGAVDHIGAGFQVNSGNDVGAELLTEYGLLPSNRRASWNVGGDSNTVCLLAPGDVRPWQHGVPGSPFDLNSYAVGYEDGILSPNWHLLSSAKETAHLRMRAAWWALCVGTLDWPLKYTDTADGVWWHIRQGRSWGFTQHGIVDPSNRSDAGLVWTGGRRVNTFDYARLFRMVREEMVIRAGGTGTTPGLPTPDPKIKTLQKLLNDFGHNLDVDGRYGALTLAACEETAEETGYTRDVQDVASFTTHMEDIMSKLDKIIDTQAAQGRQIAAIRAAQGKVTPKKIATAVWSHALYGFTAHFWLRRGSLGRKTDHENYPADPGSPADVERRVAAVVLGEEVPHYDGTQKRQPVTAETAPEGDA